MSGVKSGLFSACLLALMLGCSVEEASDSGSVNAECSADGDCPSERPICFLAEDGTGRCGAPIDPCAGPNADRDPACQRSRDMGTGGQAGAAGSGGAAGRGGAGGEAGGGGAGGAAGGGGAAGQAGAGGSGGTAGAGGEPVPEGTLALRLDTRCEERSPQTVRLVGPTWNNWDPNSGPVASDDDGDGIWQVILDPIPEEDTQYLWNVNGNYEALVGAGSCAPITDNANYANRLWTPGSGNRTDSYNTCETCVPEMGGGGGGAGGNPGANEITVQGRRLLVGGSPFHIKGVNWQPIPRGARHPEGVDYAGWVGRDAPLMEAAGVNVVRPYGPITDRAVLDALWARGIYVMNTVYSWGGSSVDSVIAPMNATMDHPAILMWVVGNEWNYNGLYNGMSFNDSLNRVREVVQLVKRTDPSRPVATIYGEVPSRDVLARLPEVDIWGLNVYRGLGFGNLFEAFAARSEKPMFLGEYGADAYNANINAEDQAAQAEATRVLTQLIVDESIVTGGVCAGGVIFEWTDEWWKAPGDPGVHDIGGAAPGGGPHPDGVFNEEWWGLLENDGTPREAYRAFSAIPVPQAP